MNMFSFLFLIRNQLKASLLMTSENKDAVLEDIAHQVIYD